MFEDNDRLVSVGGREDLDHLLAEYRLDPATVADRIRTREIPRVMSPGPVETEYLISESLLRSHGEFPCAGDLAALAFCREIVDELMSRHGLTRATAVDHVNRQWSTPATAAGRPPRIWIVGLDLAYHETPDYWADFIVGRAL